MRLKSLTKLLIFVSILVTMVCISVTVKFGGVTSSLSSGAISYAASTILSNSSGIQNYNNQRKIEEDSNGYIYTLTTPGVLRKSVDKGVTWISYNLPYNKTVSDGSIKIDSNNNIHVVWSENDNSGYAIVKYSKFNGSTWTTAQTISQTGGYSCSYASLDIDSNNNVHVVYSGYNSPYRIYYVKYTSLSQTWSSPIKVSPDGLNNYSQYSPIIKIDSNNKIYIIWQGANSGNSSDRVRFFTFDSAVTGQATGTGLINTDSLFQGYSISQASVAIDKNNDLYLVGATSNYNIVYAKYSGGNWSAWEQVAYFQGYLQSNPQISIDRDLNPHIFWEGADQKSSPKNQIQYSKKLNGTWSTPIHIAENIYYNQNGVYISEKAKLSTIYFYYYQSSNLYIDKLLINYSPKISIINPKSNQQFTDLSESIKFSILVSDDNNDNLNCYYYIDSKYGSFGSNIAYNTLTSKSVEFTPFNLSNLSKGLHTIIFEANDGVNTTTLNVNININPPPPTLSKIEVVKTSANILILDTNPNNTQYQIMCNGKYVDLSGKLINTQTWIKLVDKSIIVKGLENGKTYDFKVRARNGEGIKTIFSATSSVDTQQNPPEIPRNLRTDTWADKITLYWDESEYAATYEIEINGNTFVKSITNNYYKNSYLTPNTEYKYRVRSINNMGYSKWSNMISEKTLIAPPIAPSNITSIIASTSIKLNWGAIQNCTYEIEVDGEVINVGTKTSYTHKNLQVDTQHTYRIRSKNGAGNSEWSNLYSYKTKINLPTIPANIKYIPTNSGITVSWDEVIDATGYDIEVDNVIYNNDDSKAFFHNNLISNTIHSYRVRAKNNISIGSWSTKVSVTTLILTAPVGLSTNSDASSITLSWMNVSGATSYEVEVDGVIKLNGSSITLINGGLLSDTEHKFRVRARNSIGISAWSEEVIAYTLPIKPATPTNLYTITKKDQIILSWNAVVNCTGYDVEINSAIVDVGTDLTYIHNGLAQNIMYMYRVRAKNDSIEGDWSMFTMTKTLLDKIQPPSNVVIRGAGSIVTISWESIIGANGYDLEIDGIVKNMGNKLSYTHRKVDSNKEHIYRIRSKNDIETSKWSGLIVNNSILAKGKKGESIDLGLTASDVTDFNQYTLSVWYDSNILDIVDLCTMTKEIELGMGVIKGTDITITSFMPGKIVFTVGKEIKPGESWTGVIDSIKFKSRLSGGSAVNYIVNIKPEEE